MGNYQEVLRQMSPLREVDPGQNRVHMFGNPFKLAKDQVQSQKKTVFLNSINSFLKVPFNWLYQMFFNIDENG